MGMTRSPEAPLGQQGWTRWRMHAGRLQHRAARQSRRSRSGPTPARGGRRWRRCTTRTAWPWSSAPPLHTVRTAFTGREGPGRYWVGPCACAGAWCTTLACAATPPRPHPACQSRAADGHACLLGRQCACRPSPIACAGGKCAAWPATPEPLVRCRSDKAGRMKLTHVDSQGRAKMVDVGDKPATKRTAQATARVLLGPVAFQVGQPTPPGSYQNCRRWRPRGAWASSAHSCPDPGPWQQRLDPPPLRNSLALLLQQQGHAHCCCSLRDALTRAGGPQLVATNKLQKGDVIPAAQLAGVLGAKQTPHLIPLCHPLPLSKARPCQACTLQASLCSRLPAGQALRLLWGCAGAAQLWLVRRNACLPLVTWDKVRTHPCCSAEQRQQPAHALCLPRP